MTENRVTTALIEQQLLSKPAINLPPKERLGLLLKAKRYPIVRKKTSAKSQIEEMIDFYNLCCLMLTRYFPNEQSMNNFVLLNLITTRNNAETIVADKLAEAFKLLSDYEELENTITAIQILFHQYQEVFPDIYQSYNLENLANEQIGNIIENSRKLLISDPSYSEKLMDRWGLS